MKKSIDHTAFKNAWFAFEEILHIEKALESNTSHTHEEVREHMKNYVISSRAEIHA